MLARTWTATIEENRADEYEAFARDMSLPMFTSFHGCVGALMMRRGGECQVLTLWRDADDIEMLEASPSYRETVEGILAKGFILQTAEATVAIAHLAWFGDQ